ncbi:unnamed protein product, partial [Ascophyllum nodosum]
SAEENQRRLDNRQQLRELRIKRLRAKALGSVAGISHSNSNGPLGHGVAEALA